MKYTKRQTKDKSAAEKRDATWNKFKDQHNTLAANKRGQRQNNKSAR